MKTVWMTFAVIALFAVLPAPGAKVTHGAQVIRTPAELDHYIKTTPPDASPLSLLPVGARKRFLGTLVWGEHGLGGFDTSDLSTYLTDAQIALVLTLFDAQGYASMMHGRVTPLSETERRAPETPLGRKFDQWFFMREDTLHGAHPSDSVTGLYDRLLAPYQQPAALAKLDDNDAVLLFRAASSVSFASHDTHHLVDLRLDLAELHRRGLATSARVSQVHDLLVAARHFDEANALARQYPTADIAPLPPLRLAANVHDGNPTVLTVNPDGKSILRRAIDMHVPLRIVVIAGCHFSEDAARGIRANPVLDKLFHEHAIWLAPGNESLPDVLQWNREFPNQTMNVAWSNREWQMLDSWLIPTFYVFRDGQQVDRWNGWGTDGMERLREHLHKNGLPN
ncbi:MAG: hypothetical protein J0H27_01695 [Xanthomonadales bacterium]|nr:hypothetical protein [Xanthomonadales bacterium]ODU94850.1 MAG: hypothetical protein ABT18_02535 [Rhodanobacter sp. SCN 66-43]OJY82837.1 MAG: hypothetical protein BGP23_06995 [Xanthomonadales bacterium 66-474]